MSIFYDINGNKYVGITDVYIANLNSSSNPYNFSYRYTMAVRGAKAVFLSNTNTAGAGVGDWSVIFDDKLLNMGERVKYFDKQTGTEWADGGLANEWAGNKTLKYLTNHSLLNDLFIGTKESSYFGQKGNLSKNTFSTSPFEWYFSTYYSRFRYNNYPDSTYEKFINNTMWTYSASMSGNNASFVNCNDVSDYGISVVVDTFESLQYYLASGFGNAKLPDNIDLTTFAIDWKVYIDGTYNPSITVKWSSKYLDFDKYGNDKECMQMHSCNVNMEIPVNPGELNSITNFKTTTWNKGKIETTYTELLKDTYPSKFKQFMAKVLSILKMPFLPLVLWSELGNMDSTKMAVYFNAKGTGKIYGGGSYDINLSGYKDTIEIIYGAPPKDNGEDEDSKKDTSDSIEDGSEPSVSSLSLLTKTYALTPARLKQLGGFLWSADFMDNIKLMNNSPIENIVSCKMFPFEISGGNDVIMQVGNVSTGVNGKPVNGSTFSMKKIISGVTLSPLFGNFMDYEPFTKISVYLPFIGLKELQPSQIYNKAITLEYIVDIITGTCKCIVKASGVQIADYDGSIGIDIPVTAGNRSQQELAYITSAIGVVGSAVAGSAMGVVDSALAGVQAGFHSQTSGSASPSTAVYQTMKPYFIIDRPAYTVPSSYGHTKGWVCNKNLTIGSLSGFTKCNDNIELSNINCTQQEIEEMRSILTSGFYV